MAWKERTKIVREPETKQCVVCKKDFIPQKGKEDCQITCSYKCKVLRGNLLRAFKGRRKDRGGKNLTLNIGSKKCLYCGKEFYYSLDEYNKGVIPEFCSKKCINAHYHITKRKSWAERLKDRWNGNWSKALERDNFKCVICGNEKSRMALHHLDGSGETEVKNHDLDNLMTLCGSCHHLFHHLHLVKENGEWKIRGKILDMLNLNFIQEVN
jgi:hypothetical protein